MGGSRVKYLAPPILALAVVAGVQFFNAVNIPPAPPAAPAAEVPGRGAGDELVPVTEVFSVGAVDTSDTDRRIRFWQDRLAATPGSSTAWVYLGDLFDLKARQTGDITQFVAAREAYASALAIAPNSSDAHAGAARILATLHDFEGALREATTVLELDPFATGAIAVVFDASLELGDLGNARLALDKLARRAETPAVTVREARLAFLGGDTAEAERLAIVAAAEARGSGEAPSSIAFFEYTAAEYALLGGDLDAAAAHYEAALESLPGYPLAIYGEGRVAYARGDIELAISKLEAAVAALPRPDMLAFLGDLYAISGDADKAADQYATVEFIAQTTATDAGAVYDREYALYLADHRQDVAHALALAEAEAALRHDVHGYDTLAWALHANGRSADALAAISSALSMGAVDPKILIHAGLIELANGLATEGRAHLQAGLDLHPAFSPIVVQAAQAALEQ